MSTLVDIRTKVRRLTARPSAQHITDAQIDNYVNTFYLYDMPATLRTFSFHTFFQFMTEPNVDQYDLSTMNVNLGGQTFPALDVYYNLSSPVYIAGYQSFYTQSPEQFFRIYPQLAQIQTTLTGDGTTGPYAFTFTNVPIFQYKVTVGAVDSTGSTVQLIDSPVNRTTGNWIIINTNTSVTGSINYITGAGTVTFNNAIPSGNQITLTAVPYVANRPQAAMFYDNIVTLRPVPDASYLIQFNAYKLPSALLSDSSEPALKQYWQYLAYGAAKKVFEDSQDPEGVAQILMGLKEQEALVLRRTLVQLTNECVQTIYTEQTSFPYGNFQGRF